MPDRQPILNFREYVIGSLARIEERGQANGDHLERINGHIKELFDRTDRLDAAIKDHATECPWEDEVGKLNEMLLRGDFPATASMEIRVGKLESDGRARDAAAKAANETSKNFWDRLWPLVRIGIELLLILVLIHAAEVLNIWRLGK